MRTSNKTKVLRMEYTVWPIFATHLLLGSRKLYQIEQRLNSERFRYIYWQLKAASSIVVTAFTLEIF